MIAIELLRFIPSIEVVPSHNLPPFLFHPSQFQRAQYSLPLEMGILLVICIYCYMCLPVGDFGFLLNMCIVQCAMCLDLCV